jgi:hypothetical protein
VGNYDLWSTPSRIIYYPEDSTAFGGGFVGKYLFSYLPDARVYNCPLSPLKMDDVVFETGSEQLTYQEVYKQGEGVELLDCSYSLLWNYDGLDNDRSERRFRGPGRKSKSKLLVADALLYNEINWQDSTWFSPHPEKGFSKFDKATSCFYKKYDPLQELPQTISYNAGYTDGSVKRFKSSDMFEGKVTIATYLSIYVPIDN